MNYEFYKQKYQLLEKAFLEQFGECDYKGEFLSLEMFNTKWLDAILEAMEDYAESYADYKNEDQ